MPILNTARGLLPRRSLLSSVAALAVAQVALPLAHADPGGGAAAPAPAAQPGDFDFLTGEWRIRHRRLVDGQWDTFAGEASCWSLLGGVLHVEELRIPARDFAGSGIRLLDRSRGLWCDYWVNSRSGVLNPPSLGRFGDGRGVFEADEEDQGQPIRVRGTWDRIVQGKSHRWHQALSRDGGRNWEMNWEMFWEHAG